MTHLIGIYIAIMVTFLINSIYVVYRFNKIARGRSGGMAKIKSYGDRVFTLSEFYWDKFPYWEFRRGVAGAHVVGIIIMVGIIIGEVMS